MNKKNPVLRYKVELRGARGGVIKDIARAASFDIYYGRRKVARGVSFGRKRAKASRIAFTQEIIKEIERERIRRERREARARLERERQRRIEAEKRARKARQEAIKAAKKAAEEEKLRRKSDIEAERLRQTVTSQRFKRKMSRDQARRAGIHSQADQGEAMVMGQPIKFSVKDKYNQFTFGQITDKDARILQREVSDTDFAVQYDGSFIERASEVNKFIKTYGKRRNDLMDRIVRYEKEDRPAFEMAKEYLDQYTNKVILEIPFVPRRNIYRKSYKYYFRVDAKNRQKFQVGSYDFVLSKDLFIPVTQESFAFSFVQFWERLGTALKYFYEEHKKRFRIFHLRISFIHEIAEGFNIHEYISLSTFAIDSWDKFRDLVTGTYLKLRGMDTGSKKTRNYLLGEFPVFITGFKVEAT